MKAVMCRAYGLPESLSVEEIQREAPQKGQLLIETRACGVNFPDTLTIQGKDQYKPELPFSPGGEISGIVKEIGPGVEGFAVEDRVMSGIIWGGFREEVVVSAHNTHHMPADMDYDIGSVFLCAYGTAYHCLVDRARLRKGETLAVLGAAGGVGAALIQVGKLLGARVIACASTNEKLEVCRGLGADELINYSNVDLKNALKELTDGKGADVVCDPCGSDYTEPALRATAWGGRLMVLGFTAGAIAHIPLNLPLLKGCSVMGVFWSTFCRRQPDDNRQNIRQLVRWYGDGHLRPSIYRTYPLAEAKSALRDIMDRRVKGKIVLLP